jgi:hypothetical protein
VLPTTILHHPARTVAPDGTATVVPGLIEMTGPSSRPSPDEGWLGISHAARRLGVDSLAVYVACDTGLLPTYATAAGRLRWCRAEDVDRLRTRGRVREEPAGKGGTRQRLATELYLPTDEPSGSSAR